MAARPSLWLLVALAGAGCNADNFVALKNQPPTAALDGPSQAVVGETVTFDGSRSSDPDGAVQAFHFSFGDGATAEYKLGRHAFAAAGRYTVTLTVTDDEEATASAELTVTVTDAPVNLPPTAHISGPTTVEKGVSAHFSAAASSDPDGTIAGYAWTFGAGSALAGVAEVDHSFGTAGTVEVVLTVQDDGGLSATARHSIEVTEPEQPPPSYDGTWDWGLVNESQRDLGGMCGSFQNSTLTIVTSGTSITITEGAGLISVRYTGTLVGADFDVTNSGMLSTQRIWGTFTSATTFTGKYGLDPGAGSCADRDVWGRKQ